MKRKRKRKRKRKAEGEEEEEWRNLLAAGSGPGELDGLSARRFVGDGELLDEGGFGPLLGRWSCVLFDKAQRKPPRGAREVLALDPAALIAAHDLDDFIDLEREFAAVARLVVVPHDHVIRHPLFFSVARLLFLLLLLWTGLAVSGANGRKEGRERDAGGVALSGNGVRKKDEKRAVRLLVCRGRCFVVPHSHPIQSINQPNP